MIFPKLLAVTLFLQLIRQTVQIDCQYSDNCKVDVSIAHITCEENGSECTCVGDSCGTLNTESLTYSDLDPALCGGTKCTEETSCTFWKFRKEGTTAAHTKHCYLMSETQCVARDDDVTCPEFIHNTPTCESGFKEGTACGDSTPTPRPPSPPTTTPSLYPNCPGPIVAGDDATMYYQEWFCYEKIDGMVYPRNMYKQDSSMPVGGFCELIDSDESCKDSTYRYTCTGKEDDMTMTSEWKNSNGVDDDLKGDQLKEIGCKANDYIVDPKEQEGRMISCANEITDSKIVENNVCIMLCDGIPAFSIYTDFKARGSRAWFYELTGNPSSKGELAAGMLDCWGKR